MLAIQYHQLALEIYNANYIGGDINGGSLQLSQLLMRPVPRLNPYSTLNEKIVHMFAATPPGSGVLRHVWLLCRFIST